MQTLADGKLNLKASFRAGSQTFTFAADYLRVLEFNSATFNPGAPPASLPPAVAAKLGGTIYFRDRNRKPASCGDISIANGTVTCDKKPQQRADVLRIVFSH